MAAAIVDGDRLLAIRRRDNGKWEPPGGTLEPEETILSGLRREVLEETGIAIQDARLSGVYKNMTEGIVALVFRCVSVGGEPQESAEVAEARWLTAAQVQELMEPAYAIRLLDSLNLQKPAIRAHDGVHLLGHS